MASLSAAVRNRDISGLARSAGQNHSFGPDDWTFQQQSGRSHSEGVAGYQKKQASMELTVAILTTGPNAETARLTGQPIVPLRIGPNWMKR
jgi:hypothetical protein